MKSVDEETSSVKRWFVPGCTHLDCRSHLVAGRPALATRVSHSCITRPQLRIEPMRAHTDEARAPASAPAAAESSLASAGLGEGMRLAAQPELVRRTAAVRIAIITAMVTAGLVVVLITETYKSSFFPFAPENCFLASIDGSDIYEDHPECLNSLWQFPLVVFDVSWPANTQYGYALDGVSLRCNERETPGGDCYALIREKAPLIAWGTQLTRPGSIVQIVSTSSLLVREIGLDPGDGLSGLPLLRALTLGAYDATPLLGVKFNLDASAILYGHTYDYEVAAMAYTVLRNANLPRDVLLLSGQPGCGGQVGWLRNADTDTLHRFVGEPQCTFPACYHQWDGSGIDERNLGLFSFKQRPRPSGNGTCWTGASDFEQLIGANLLHTECGHVLPATNGSTYTTWGWRASCLHEQSSRGSASAAWLLCFLYILFTASLGCIAAMLIVYLIRSRTMHLAKDTQDELRAAFPRLHAVSKAEGVEVQAVIHRSTSLFMYLEAALDGDLVVQFENPKAGAVGALLHAAMILMAALPLHANAIYNSVLTWPPSVLLCALYGENYVYLVAYYLRRLPLGWPRLLQAHRIFTLFFFVLTVSLISMNLMFMLAAFAYNPGYITHVFLLLLSVTGFVYSAVSAAGRMAALKDKTSAGDDFADALLSVGMKQVASKVVGVEMPQGADTMAQLLEVKVRPALEPVLFEYRLTWEETRPVLELVDSNEELGRALLYPRGFLEELEAGAGSAARKFLHVRIRAVLEPLLAPASTRTSLTWDDVRPNIELMDSCDELRAAIADPHAFLQTFAQTAATSLGKRWLIEQLKKVIQPYLTSAGIAWEKAGRVIELIDTIDEIKEAISDPQAFTEKVKQAIADEEADEQNHWTVSDVVSTAETAAELTEAVVETAKVARAMGQRAKAVVDKLALTRRQLRSIFLVGGSIFLLTTIMTVVGMLLWNRGGGTSFFSLTMPVSVVITKYLGDRKITQTERESTSEDEGKWQRWDTADTAAEHLRVPQAEVDRAELRRRRPSSSLAFASGSRIGPLAGSGIRV